MRRQLFPALMMTIVLTVICGVIYPVAVWGVSQLTMSHQADGSFITVDGKTGGPSGQGGPSGPGGRIVGSSLIGQSFTQAKYFHPRPSAAGTDGYDAMASGGSNLGPTNQKLLDAISQRVADYRTENGLSTTQQVPVDAVTASGSGLDPEISVANARFQAPRVARERAVAVDQVLAAVKRHTRLRTLGFLGEDGVNVLEVNLDLDGYR